jgi:hypothetical protein
MPDQRTPDRSESDSSDVEDYPLTRIRILVQQLRQSIRLDESLADLAPFRPGDD